MYRSTSLSLLCTGNMFYPFIILSSKRCDSVTVRVLKYLLSNFQLYISIIFFLLFIFIHFIAISCHIATIQTNNEELNLPYIYWILKMHKYPYKHRFVAGSSKCSTKSLSILPTKLLAHIKQGIQKFCEAVYSRSGINQMWILNNSNEF